ncbi:hypothetical protein ACIPSA_18240 [Streptomyces sp. NPDC086549]
MKFLAVTLIVHRPDPVTGADESLIAMATHDHADRVRSYELLAQERRRR